MKRRLILLYVSLACAIGAWAQQTSFPYPEVPSRISDLPTRLTFMLQHFWERYDFSNTSPANQQVGEQGFVDFINLMQYADSSTCARAAQVFADSIGTAPRRLEHFESLAGHYLEDPQSPLRSDSIYLYLLRALPSTPQRQFLIHQLSMNQPGTAAADITFVSEEGVEQRLYDVKSPLTLLVFHDPLCDHCQEQMPHIRTAFADVPHLKVLYIDTNRNPQVLKSYHLPVLPSLYLLNKKKQVLIKDGTIQQISEKIAIRK